MSITFNGSGQSVLQVVQGSSSAVTSTTSTSFVTTGLSATITPQSTNSKILILVNGTDFYQTTSTASVTVTVYRNSTNIAPIGSSYYQCFGLMYNSAGAIQSNLNISYLDSPSTTSPTTYTLYFAVTGGFGQINANSTGSYIQLIEISGS